MDILLAETKEDNILVLMRRLGYAVHSARRTGIDSYTRRVGALPFPRYHIYVETKSGAQVLRLHLDQKAPSYEGSHAHSGEYSGPLVEKEAERIKRFVGG